MRTIGMSDMSDPTRALGPEEAADRTFAAHGHDSDWLDAFTERLDRLRGGASVARTIEVRGLSQAEARSLRRRTARTPGGLVGRPAEPQATTGGLGG